MTGNKIALALVFFALGIALAQTVPSIGWSYRARDWWAVGINGMNFAAVVAACVMGMLYL